MAGCAWAGAVVLPVNGFEILGRIKVRDRAERAEAQVARLRETLAEIAKCTRANLARLAALDRARQANG